jgi:SAM-dependent methyltransferase
MGDDRWWRGFDATVAAELAPGSRILDVGCGDGGLVERFVELGYEALGVDPKAPAHARLLQTRLEDADHLGRFDAITAVMALHHADLEAVVPALRRLLRVDGWLFLSELEWNAYDERAAAWLAANDPSEADNSVAGWIGEHDDLHTGATMRAALSAAFAPVADVPRPYLARMLGRHGLEAGEQALIDAGAMPALGFWYVARPRGTERGRRV